MATVIDNGMVDTMVFIWGLGGTTKKDAKGRQLSEKERTAREACARLLRMMNPIRISSVTWFEYALGRTEAEGKALAALLGKVKGKKPKRHLDIKDMTPAAAEDAVRLYRAMFGADQRCRSCLNEPGAIACLLCGGLKSRQKRMNDVFIAATAEVAADVRVLYSYDGGVLKLGEHMKKTVTEPENPFGPLFEKKENVVRLMRREGGAA